MVDMEKLLQCAIELTSNAEAYQKIIEGQKIAARQLLSKGTICVKSFHMAFAQVYIMVLSEKGAVAYEILRDVITSYLQSDLKAQILAYSNDVFIEQLAGIWTKYSHRANILSAIYKHMDEKYVRLTVGTYPAGHLAISSFRDELICDADVKNKLIAAIWEALCASRNGEVINCAMVQQMCHLLLHLEFGVKSVYADFESAILDRTADFYKAERAKWLTDGDVHYLLKTEAALRDEEKRVSECLAEVTLPKILTLVGHVLIESHFDEILRMEKGGLKELIAYGQKDLLALMYKLFSQFKNGVNSIAQYLESVTRRCGLHLIHSFRENPTAIRSIVEFITIIVELHELVANTVRDAFSNDSVIKHAIFGAFRFLSTKEPTLSEHLAWIISDLLKQPMEHESEQKLQMLINSCMAIYPYLQDKDIFEFHYKYGLARRLLFYKCISGEMEQFMVDTLRKDCGHEFISKLECMYGDLFTSNITNPPFQAYLRECAESGENMSQVKLGVYVLTSSAWPFSTENLSCNLPEEAYRQFLKFREFYGRLHPHRSLTIYPKKGNASLAVFYEQDHYVDGKGNLKPRYPRTIKVSTFQMCVLMLFNESLILSYADIKAMTGIEESNLKLTLLSLAYIRIEQKILSKVPANKEICEDDIFFIDETFTSDEPILRVLTITKKPKGVKPTEICEFLVEDRKQEIDATIVRIMKKERVLSHELLIRSVLSTLEPRFTPELDDVVKRIDELVNREFIARSTEDSTSYVYVA